MTGSKLIPPVIALALAASAAANQSGPVPPPPPAIQTGVHEPLDSPEHGRVDGPARSSNSDGRVIGDFDGDGIDDLVVDAERASPFRRSIYVVAGRRKRLRMDLRERKPLLRTGRRTTRPLPVGDLNGDELADFAIGSWTARPHGRHRAGAVDIVFGRRHARGAGRLRDLSGLRIDGPRRGVALGAPAPGFGETIAPAGDVNRDGYDDLLVGAPAMPRNGALGAGRVYLVLGGRGGRIDLARRSRRVIEFIGLRGDPTARRSPYRNASLTGVGVAGLGDVNGDRFPDIAIGSPGARPTDYGDRGVVTVVFGSAKLRRRIDLRDARGFAVIGRRGQGVGRTLRRAGDVNGDGLDDLVLPAGLEHMRGVAGDVVFGARRTTPVRLGSLGRRGFWLSPPYDGWDISGAGTGDMDRDGFGELAFAARRSDPRRFYTGLVSLLHGRRSWPKQVELEPPARGMRAYETPGTAGGPVIELGGDLNGDKRPDMVVSYAADEQNGREESGSVYVVYGSSSWRDSE